MGALLYEHRSNGVTLDVDDKTILRENFDIAHKHESMELISKGSEYFAFEMYCRKRIAILDLATIYDRQSVKTGAISVLYQKHYNWRERIR